jgi:HEPN domain-containing protein
MVDEQVNRADFQALAIERSLDAEVLLRSGRYACAYYIAGYAVECALKAIISSRTQQEDFPPKEAARYYTHDLTALVGYAGLDDALNWERSVDLVFNYNWNVVEDWKEDARYQGRERKKAEDMVSAVTDPDHGILQWLRRDS